MSWPVVALPTIADFHLGKMLDKVKNKGEPRSYLANLNVRWGGFDLTNLRKMKFTANEFDRYSLLLGDIVMCEGGEPGRCAYWSNEVSGIMFQKALHRIRAKDSIDSKFLFYQLWKLGAEGALSKFFTGATIKHLPREQLARVEVTLPPLPIQKRIAGILSAYDDLIAVNERRITILEEMARRVFEESMNEVETAPTPMNRIAKIDRGKSYRSADLLGEGKPFVNLKCIERDGGFRVSGLKSFSGFHKENHVVRNGDIVVAVTDMTQDRRIVAQAARISGLPNPGVASMDLIIARAIDVEQQVFLYAMLRWTHFSENLKEHANGANVLHLSPKLVENYEIDYPGQNDARRISNQLSSLLMMMDNLSIQNTNLRATRDLLLPRLISGEFDVSDVSELPKTVAAE